MSERTARLDQLLQEEISRIVAREVEDPRVGFATVTRVETSPDLRHARVWVSIIGQPDERRTTFRALARAMPFVRHELGVLRLKRIPELHLELDESLERGTRVMRILDDLEAGREPEPSELRETLPTPGPLRPAEPGADEEADSAGADAMVEGAGSAVEGAARPQRRRGSRDRATSRTFAPRRSGGSSRHGTGRAGHRSGS